MVGRSVTEPAVSRPSRFASFLLVISVVSEFPGMSYDLAIWEGEQLAAARATGRCFSGLYNCYLDSEIEEPPSERITAYVVALLSAGVTSPRTSTRRRPGRSGR